MCPCNSVPYHADLSVPNPFSPKSCREVITQNMCNNINGCSSSHLENMKSFNPTYTHHHSLMGSLPPIVKRTHWQSFHFSSNQMKPQQHNLQEQMMWLQIECAATKMWYLNVQLLFSLRVCMYLRCFSLWLHLNVKDGNNNSQWLVHYFSVNCW